MRDQMQLLLAALASAGIGWAMYHYLDGWMTFIAFGSLIYVVLCGSNRTARRRQQRQARERTRVSSDR